MLDQSTERTAPVSTISAMNRPDGARSTGRGA